MSKNYNNLIPNHDRKWDETVEGEEDQDGFFYTPEGSKNYS
jgi:hypothetical protein